MKLFEAGSKLLAIRHPFAALQFLRGNKHSLHRAVILDCARHLFAERFVEGTWNSALKEIERNELIPAVVNENNIRVGNTINTTFGKWIYCCVRALQPQHIVETGVAHGASSLIILNALHKNGKGRLTSIDLPGHDTNANYNFNEPEKTGWMVPVMLRDRWDLHIGNAKEILPLVLEKLGAIDIFFHDSDHSYEHMQFEFETAKPFVTEGGIILSDDVDKNNAFKEFAVKYDLNALQFNKGGCARLK